MKKRVLSLILVVAMIASMLMACGKDDKEDDAASNKPNTEIKVADVKPTLKLLGSSSTADLNDTIEAKVIEEATGYKVEYHGLPAENANQALMLTLANDNDYDLVTMNQNQFTTLRSNGALLALNDYIDAIAPELWDCISEDAWKGVSDEEGNVYAFPKLYSAETEVASFMVVRMDLCRKAGITELPTTISEFKDMLVTLKDYYGDDYIILSGPYNPAKTGNRMNIPMNISSAFGIYNDWMVDENGKVIYMTEHENFDDMMNFMNDLYKEGIIDIDYASNSSTGVDEKLASGKAIIAMNSRETLNTTFATLQESGLTEDDIEYIGALHGDDGTCTYMQTAQYGSFTGIPVKNAKNAADTVAWIAAKVENQELIAIGEEGVHFNWVDGYPVPIQPTFTDERNKSSSLTHFADMETYQIQFSARLQKTEIMWKAYTNCTIAANENEPEIFVPAYFAYCNSDTYATNNTALLKSLNDYISLLVVGQRNLDSDMKTFTSDFENFGGEDMRKELQEWYDAAF